MVTPRRFKAQLDLTSLLVTNEAPQHPLIMTSQHNNTNNIRLASEFKPGRAETCNNNDDKEWKIECIHVTGL